MQRHAQILLVVKNTSKALVATLSVAGLWIADMPSQHRFAAVACIVAFLLGWYMSGKLRFISMGLALLGAAATSVWLSNSQLQSTIGLTGLYDEQGGDKCYRGIDVEHASITLSGRKTQREFVTCQYSEKSPSMQRTYFFNLPTQTEGQEVVDFRGDFGIDEDDSLIDALEHPDAVGAWVVSQAGQELCRVRASWKYPATCSVAANITLRPGEPLVIEETLILGPGEVPQQFLWLGISKPRLVVES